MEPTAIMENGKNRLIFGQFSLLMLIMLSKIKQWAAPVISGLLTLSAANAGAATPISGITTFTGPETTLAFGAANGEGLLAENVFGYDFNLVMNTGDELGLYVGDLVWGTGNGVQYYPDNSSALSMNRLSVTSNGGEDFSLRGFGLSLTSMNVEDDFLTVVVTGFRDGSSVATFSRILTLADGSVTSLEAFDVSAVPGFDSVDEFRITSGAGAEIGYLGIDNLDAVNFVPEPSSAVLGMIAALALAPGFRRRR